MHWGIIFAVTVSAAPQAAIKANPVLAGLSGEMFATVDRALDERTIGHNPERLCLMKVGAAYCRS